MEWTRESRYKKYSEWDAETLLKLQAQATASKYQMSYHIRPQSGLLNDPNGFSYFNDEYHVFYQSYPFGAVHGLKLGSFNFSRLSSLEEPRISNQC